MVAVLGAYYVSFHSCWIPPAPYSSIPNMASRIASHNRGGATTSPLDGKCLTVSLVYKAIIKSGDQKSEYIGLASTTTSHHSRTVNRKTAQDSLNMFGIWRENFWNKMVRNVFSNPLSKRNQQMQALLNRENSYHSYRKQFINKQKTWNYVKMSTEKRCFWKMQGDKVCIFFN